MMSRVCLSSAAGSDRSSAILVFGERRGAVWLV